ncbi:MAG: hypothetical protein R2788_26720 [Saprospiraceae bacterium]
MESLKKYQPYSDNNYCEYEQLFEINPGTNSPPSEEIITKSPAPNYFFNVLIYLCLFGPGIYFIHSGLIANESPYPDLLQIMMGLSFVTVGLINAFLPYFKKQYRIKGDLLFSKRPMDKQFKFLGKINGFGQDVFLISKYHQANHLTICTDSGNYVFNETDCANFKEVATYFENHFPDYGKQAFKAKTKAACQILGVILLASLPLLYLAWQSEQAIGKGVDIEQLMNLELTLSESPALIVATNRNGTKSRHMEIKTEEFPGFIFFINSRVLGAADERISRIPAGKKIAIKILTDQYESKLVQTKEPGFWTRHINWRHIYVFELKYGKDHLLDVEKYRHK